MFWDGLLGVFTKRSTIFVKPKIIHYLACVHLKTCKNASHIVDRMNEKAHTQRNFYVSVHIISCWPKGSVRQWWVVKDFTLYFVFPFVLFSRNFSFLSSICFLGHEALSVRSVLNCSQDPQPTCPGRTSLSSPSSWMATWELLFKYSQKRCPSLLSNDMKDKESKRDIMPGFHLHFVWSKSGRYEAVHCLNNLDAKKLLQF